MKRIAIFRFHHQFDLCLDRIALLRRFNSELPIFPLYGGPLEALEAAKQFCHQAGLGRFFRLDNDDPKWKWRNGDLVVQQWFKSVGKELNFEYVHIFEWDMLVFGNLNEMYAGLEGGVIPLGAKAAEEAKPYWWLYSPECIEEGKKLWDFIYEKYGVRPLRMACVFGGICLSRRFLEKASRVQLPPLLNDEVRTLAVAQIVGEQIVSAGIYENWFVDPVFNARKREVKEEDILKVLAEKGSGIFHPYYKPWTARIELPTERS